MDFLAVPNDKIKYRTNDEKPYLPACVNCGLVDMKDGTFSYMEIVNREKYKLDMTYLSKHCMKKSFNDQPYYLVDKITATDNFKKLPESCLELVLGEHKNEK